MRPAGVFLGGMLAGAGAFALATYVYDHSSSVKPSQRATRTPTMSAAPPPLQRSETPAHASYSREQSLLHSLAAPSLDATELIVPKTSDDWNALVGGMLEWAVEHRTGERLTAEKRHRLVSELARLREASLALQEAPAEPSNPVELRERLARTLTLVEVDQAFRRELGVGVSEFVHEQDLESGAFEDVSRR